MDAKLKTNSSKGKQRMWSPIRPLFNTLGDDLLTPHLPAVNVDDLVFEDAYDKRVEKVKKDFYSDEITHCYNEFSDAHVEYAKIDLKDPMKGHMNRFTFDHLLMVFGQMFFYLKQAEMLYNRQDLPADKGEKAGKQIAEMKSRIQLAYVKYDITNEMAKKAAVLYSVSTDARVCWTSSKRWR